MNEKRSGECEYCGHMRYTNDLFNGECVPCVTWAEDLINALTAEVKRLKSKRICACGATVEELVIGEVTYRTNASSTNAKLMADVARLQAELEKQGGIDYCKLRDLADERFVEIETLKSKLKKYTGDLTNGQRHALRTAQPGLLYHMADESMMDIDAAIRAAREGER